MSITKAKASTEVFNPLTRPRLAMSHIDEVVVVVVVATMPSLATVVTAELLLSGVVLSFSPTATNSDEDLLDDTRDIFSGVVTARGPAVDGCCC